MRRPSSTSGAAERVSAKVRQLRDDQGLGYLAATAWSAVWVRLAWRGPQAKLAATLATWSTPPYYGRRRLARLHPRGFRSPSARVHHPLLRTGRHVYLGDRVLIYQHGPEGGPVVVDDDVRIYDQVTIQTGRGGRVHIGAGTSLQPRCQLSAYVAAIDIGRDVQIAPACAFYPYDHAVEPGTPIVEQPMWSKGDITVGDGAWLGYGVVVLAGVRIGAGAVVGAGSVVTTSVPDGAIAVGNPARVVGHRGDAAG